jgi:hypothetical protein
VFETFRHVESDTTRKITNRWHHFYEWYRARKQRTVLVWVADHKCNVINHVAWVLGLDFLVSHISKVINHI